MPWYEFGGQRPTFRSQLSLSATWIWGIKLRHQDWWQVSFLAEPSHQSPVGLETRGFPVTHPKKWYPVWVTELSPLSDSNRVKDRSHLPRKPRGWHCCPCSALSWHAWKAGTLTCPPALLPHALQLSAKLMIEFLSH